LAVQCKKAEVVALLDAHAVGGRVGVGEGVGERGKESEQNLSSKDNELLSVASTGLRLCFVTEWFSFIWCVAHAWQGGRAPGKLWNVDGVMASSTTTSKQRGRLKEEY
jgi:hypothetical protein